MFVQRNEVVKFVTFFLFLVMVIALSSTPTISAPSDVLKRLEPTPPKPPKVNRFPQFNGTTAGMSWQSDMRFLSSYKSNRGAVGATDFDSFELSSRKTIQNGTHAEFMTNDGHIKSGYFQKQNGKFTEMRNGRINDHFIRRQHDSGRLDHIRNRHIGKDKTQLISEARKGTASNKGVSSYTNEINASKFTSQSITRNQKDIDNWIRSANQGDLSPAFRSSFPNQITGFHVAKGGNQARSVSSVEIVLKADPSLEKGYRLHTTYPVP